MPYWSQFWHWEIQFLSLVFDNQGTNFDLFCLHYFTLSSKFRKTIMNGFFLFASAKCNPFKLLHHSFKSMIPDLHFGTFWDVLLWCAVIGEPNLGWAGLNWARLGWIWPCWAGMGWAEICSKDDAMETNYCNAIKNNHGRWAERQKSGRQQL